MNGQLSVTTAWDQPRSLYVHVPFCRHRCGYCDFTLVAGRDDLIDRYLAALEIDLALQLPEPVEVDTLFFGGGTPSHLPPERLERLFRLVQERAKLVPGAEFAIEANPLDLTEARIETLLKCGVNRVSVGVQSFQSSELAVLERDHSPDEARQLIRRLQQSIPNVGIDLIFGVPNQTLSLWEENLQAAIELKPAHLSTYGLTFEKGTAFWSRRAKGLLNQQPEETERQMYELAMNRLSQAGYRHYELSNFALPGFECRHNLVYWNARSYYAAGPGAASYLQGIRRTNHRSTTTWIDKVLNERTVPVGDMETLTPEDRAREAIMLGLRQIAGIRIETFAERFGFDLIKLCGSALPQMLSQGLLQIVDGHLRLTREGIFVADTVVSEFLVADD